MRDGDVTALFRIPADHVMQVWAQVAPLLEKSLAILSTHDIEDVRKSLIVGTAHLWVKWSGEADVALVTEFCNYPKGLWLRIWLTGAREPNTTDWREVASVIDKAARELGCKGLEVIGRHAWARIFPDAEVEGLLLRRTF